MEIFEQQKAQTPRPGPESRHDDMFGENLSADRVETTLEIDELLPTAIAAVGSLLPKGWLDEQPRQMTRIHDLLNKDAVLSLTKGVRPASENGPVHRFRQAVHLCRDYMEDHPLYDHFAGAMLVPLMVQLARQGSNLAEVSGDRDERLRLLWDGESDHSRTSKRNRSKTFSRVSASLASPRGRLQYQASVSAAVRTPRRSNWS
ncbi:MULTISPECIES: hypothetical protein [unclassified Bradyrhizobium]|uniref:hypothetical protein n=1 Tax=unclassified Bradyrhizobium TaxID=2631580 RepID=UPI0028EC9FFE|nr:MULTISPECIES: hypothetical protein [unclassified Bradyrhizobium]